MREVRNWPGSGDIGCYWLVGRLIGVYWVVGWYMTIYNHLFPGKSDLGDSWAGSPRSAVWFARLLVWVARLEIGSVRLSNRRTHDQLGI